MNSQVTPRQRAAAVQRGPGYYLMQLRQHASDAEVEARRAKLLVGEWSPSRIQFVPILQRPARIGPG